MLKVVEDEILTFLLTEHESYLEVEFENVLTEQTLAETFTTAPKVLIPPQTLILCTSCSVICTNWEWLDGSNIEAKRKCAKSLVVSI